MEVIDEGKIMISNNVVIEQNVHIISDVSIEDNTTIAANTFSTNFDHGYSDITKGVMVQGFIYKETTIGEGCFLGYGSGYTGRYKIGLALRCRF